MNQAYATAVVLLVLVVRDQYPVGHDCQTNYESITAVQR